MTFGDAGTGTDYQRDGELFASPPLGGLRLYGETVGSPGIQKRHGDSSVPPAPDTPVRGPRANAIGAAAASGSSRRIGPVSRSSPLSARVMASATQRRAGPRARSASVLLVTRRERASSSPSTTSPARTRIAEASPTADVTMFAQTCIP